MPDSLFRRVVVPVANRWDAESTTAALAPYVSAAGGTVIAVHVYDDSELSAEERAAEEGEEFPDAIFEQVVSGLEGTGVDVETELLSGENVARAVIDAAHDHDASAIVFTPRGGSRWIKLLTGDVTTALVAESDVPVLALPDADDPDVDSNSDSHAE